MWSTVLFIEETPVGYTITKEEEKYFFAPSEYSHSGSKAPLFFAYYLNISWQFVGLQDAHVIEQAQLALEGIVTNNDIELSAAV